MSGIIGTSLGLRSPGTAHLVCHDYVGEIEGLLGLHVMAVPGTDLIPTLMRRPGPFPRPSTEDADQSGS